MSTANVHIVSEAIRVLIVDDEALVRHALRAFIAADPRVVLVGEAADGAGIQVVCAQTRPDVVLMDLKMPGIGGIDATRSVLGWNADCRVVVLTTFTTEWRALEALRAGACGYLVKDSTPDQIIGAIVAAHAGDRVVSPQVQAQFVRYAVGAEDPDRGEYLELSERERRIIELVALGMPNAEIADELHYAEGTVKADIRSINRKWGVQNRLQIVLRATRLGLIHL